MQKRADVYRQEGETKEQCFTRYIQSEEGRRAYAVYKTLPNTAPEPQPVAKVVASSSPSLARLNKLAAELNTREPGLSRDQAFAKVYADPKHRELVRRERDENRPSLTAEVEKDGARSVIGERVMRLATALGKTHRGMSHDECVDAVLRANPDLRRAWEREQEQAA